MSYLTESGLEWIESYLEYCHGTLKKVQVHLDGRKSTVDTIGVTLVSAGAVLNVYLFPEVRSYIK